MKHYLCGVFLLCAIFLCTQGCLKMGPDFEQPEMDFQIPDNYQQARQEDILDETDPDRWWESFNNPKIDALVRQVATNNLDIRKSTALVLELQARLAQTHSRRFPGFSGSGSARKSQATTSTITSILPFEMGTERNTINTYTLSLPASFELDLWGRLARADEAGQYDLLQVTETRRTLIHSIISEAVSLYLEMESLERKIAINELKIKNYEKNLELVEKRYSVGLSNALEIRQTRRALTQAQSVMPSYYQALGQIQHLLAVLVGQYPQTSPVKRHPEDYYKQLSPVPIGLPSELLLRRPDIRAAQAGLAAASARIGEAKASRFPSITLTGAYGTTSTELDQMFKPGAEFWNIAAGITAPIFDAGLRKAVHKATIARYEQQKVAYAKTILSAFSEVETALLTREQQLIRRKQLLDYLEEARGVQEMATKRYEKGLLDYLNVLEAVTSRFRAEEDMIASDLALMQNRVTLYRALGGGWPSVEDATEATDTSGKTPKRDSEG